MLRTHFFHPMLRATADAVAPAPDSRSSSWWYWRLRHRRVGGGAGRKRRRAEDADFLRRRLALVDADNRAPCAGADRTQQRVNATAADRPRRAEIERTVAKSAWAGIPAAGGLQRDSSRRVARHPAPKTRPTGARPGIRQHRDASGRSRVVAPGPRPEKNVPRSTRASRSARFTISTTRNFSPFSGQSLENAQNRVILAHELTHALEDQQFRPVERLPLEVKGNDDRGHGRQRAGGGRRHAGDESIHARRHVGASALKDSLASAFNDRCPAARGGAALPARNFAVPVSARAGILPNALPDRRLGGLGGSVPAPAPITRRKSCIPRGFSHAVPGRLPPSDAFPRVEVLGREPIGNNVLGEFGIRQWLARTGYENDADASEIAANWQADRYLVYGDANKAQLPLEKRAGHLRARRRDFSRMRRLSAAGASATASVEQAFAVRPRHPAARELTMPNGHRLTVTQHSTGGCFNGCARPAVGTKPSEACSETVCRQTHTSNARHL